MKVNTGGLSTIIITTITTNINNKEYSRLERHITI